MADASKLKGNRKLLGTPPVLNEASNNLTAPELAPKSPIQESMVSYKRWDGRSARRTNRTLPFATRVTEEFDRLFREIAQEEGLLIVELLERSLDAYIQQRNADK